MATIDDFQKLEIKIGKILSADRIEGSDKLLKLIFDVGEAEPRQILAGIAEHVEDPQTLMSKELPVILNLEPRKMRGEISYGMILAASTAEGAPILLHPAVDVPPGTIVR